MSLHRTIYYFCVVSGWTALLGWATAELSLWLSAIGSNSWLGVMLSTGIVGAWISAGISAIIPVSHMAYSQLPAKIAEGILLGAIGGIVAGLAGNTCYVCSQWLGEALGWDTVVKFVGLTIGWAVLGVCLGSVTGILERSSHGVRNGAIGGAIGGALGGVLFLVIKSLLSSPLSSRATAFVALGICIGFMVGLVKAILRQAWVSVVEGYGSGRELILDRDLEWVGRSDSLRLSFRGESNANLPDQAFCIRLKSPGCYVVEPKESIKIASNNQPFRDIRLPTQIADGDRIKFGINLIVFHQRVVKHSSQPIRASQAQQATQTAQTLQSSQPTTTSPPPPKPVHNSKAPPPAKLPPPKPLNRKPN